MKQIITTILTFLSLHIAAQTQYSTYTTSYVDKTYKASVGFDDKDNYMVFLEMFSLDKLDAPGGIVMDEAEHIVFTRQVWEARQKYAEWSETARKNNIQNFEKIIDMPCYTKAYFLFANEWRFQFLVKLVFAYKVIDGNHLLVVKTPKLQDDKNEFVAHDGFAIIFSSPNEIDKFIINTSKEKVIEFKKQQELFRD